MNRTWKKFGCLVAMAMLITVVVSGCVVHPVPTPGAAEMSAKSDEGTGGGSTGNDGAFAQDAGTSAQGPSLSADTTATAATDAGLDRAAD